jgi:hypothetical protein
MVIQKLGLPKNLSNMIGQLWDSTIHLIKTIHGTSTVTCGSTAETPLYSPGQGSMCGPLYWLLCQWLIVESLDPSIQIAEYISACCTILTKITGVSFVDGTGLGTTFKYTWNDTISPAENSRRELIHVLEHLQTLASTGSGCFLPRVEP